MSIKEVTMYRVECDHDGCDASPQDAGEFHAWAQVEGALDDLSSAGNWYADDDRHLCPEHAPRCPEQDCGVTLWDAEFGVFCEDHAPKSVAS